MITQLWINIYSYIYIIIPFLLFIVTQDLPTHILINLYPGIFPHAGKINTNSLLKKWRQLTHWGRDKMAAIFQTTFSNAFSRMKMNKFRLGFHWSLFLGFELISLATSHYLNQWWLVYWCIYVSLGLNELKKRKQLKHARPRFGRLLTPEMTGSLCIAKTILSDDKLLILFHT